MKINIRFSNVWWLINILKSNKYIFIKRSALPLRLAREHTHTLLCIVLIALKIHKNCIMWPVSSLYPAAGWGSGCPFKWNLQFTLLGSALIGGAFKRCQGQRDSDYAIGAAGRCHRLRTSSHAGALCLSFIYHDQQARSGR